jgi:hypothetical protein
MKFDRLLPAAIAVLACGLAAHAQSGILLTATSHNFVSVPEGSTAKYGIHITNKSDAAFPFQLSLTGSPNFTKQTDCPATIAVGSGCEVVFQYSAPSTSQWEEAKFAIASNGASFPNGNEGTLRAHAVTPNAITLNTQKHNFGETAVGSPAAQKFGLNISNGSTTSVPFSYKTTGDTAAYSVESNCPSSLAAGGQCSIVFGFKPTAKAWQGIQVELSTGSVPVAGGNTVTLVGQGS